MRLRRKIIAAFFLVSSLISVLLALVLYRFVERQLGSELQARLRDVAHLGAHGIDRAVYGRLRAELRPDLTADAVAAIEASADFRALSTELNAIRGTEPELIRFAYVLAPSGDPDRPRFVGDADVLTAKPGEEISHFGEAYDVSRIPLLRRALTACTPEIERDFVHDPDFGVHSISAYVPLGGAAGSCLGVLGVDIIDRDMRAALDEAGGLALRVSLAVILLALVVSVAMGTVLTRSVLALSDTVTRFANKDFAARTSIRSRDEIGQLATDFNAMAATIQLHNDQLEQLVQQRTSELHEEKQTSERLLLNVLPAPIAERLKRRDGVIVDRFERVSVLFADIVGFTELSSVNTPESVVTMLDDLFSRFDRLAEIHGLEKIKTIGDAYMIVAGIPEPRDDDAEAIARMALDMLAEVGAYSAERGTEISIRIGIHSGSVIAGVIGKKKFIYDLWGDTVNTASRMESHGLPGRVHVTQAVHDRLRERFDLEPRGTVDVKGKGPMPTYLLVRERHVPN